MPPNEGADSRQGGQNEGRRCQVMATFDEFYESLPEDSNKRGEYFEKVFVPWFLKTDPCGPGPLQPIKEVPFLFSHRTLLISTPVLVRVDWKWEGEKYGSRLKRRPPRRESRLRSL